MNISYQFFTSHPIQLQQKGLFSQLKSNQLLFFSLFFWNTKINSNNNNINNKNIALRNMTMTCLTNQTWACIRNQNNIILHLTLLNWPQSSVAKALLKLGTFFQMQTCPISITLVFILLLHLCIATNNSLSNTISLSQLIISILLLSIIKIFIPSPIILNIFLLHPTSFSNHPLLIILLWNFPLGFILLTLRMNSFSHHWLHCSLQNISHHPEKPYTQSKGSNTASMWSHDPQGLYDSRSMDHQQTQLPQLQAQDPCINSASFCHPPSTSYIMDLDALFFQNVSQWTLIFIASSVFWLTSCLIFHMS